MTLATEAVDPRLSIGGNTPPLSEVLAEEFSADKERMTELVDAANSYDAVTNSETMQRVTTLAGLLRAHYDDVEIKRKARKKPYDDGASAVQNAANPILHPLTAALARLRTICDAYNAEQDRLRDAERRRLAEEEDKKRREAEEAQAKADAAKAEGKSGLSAELAAVKARDDADAAARARTQVVAPIIRTDVGKASRTTVTTYEIDDLTKVAAYLRQTQRAALIEAIQPLVNRLGRAGIVVPGVKVNTAQQTRFGR